MIDFHSQLLNDVGLESFKLKSSIETINAAIQSGFNKLVVTPTYIGGLNPDKSYDEKLQLLERLNLICTEKNINLTLYFGQEIVFSQDIVPLLDDSHISTINNTQYVLITFNQSNNSFYSVLNNIFDLQVAGYRPILCHPERYQFVINNPSIVKDLIRRDIIIQLDCLSILGTYGDEVKNTAKAMLKGDMVHLLGTDAKSPQDYENSAKAYKKIKKIVGEHKYNELTQTTPNTILQDTIYYPHEPKEERKKLFGILG